ncbi:Sodium/hydrogen exchanger 2 [Nymphon striatum]|nr:Sodium/hydrogen exchanger 2 [Nymphon striatum]
MLKLTMVEALVFSALISAVDPVAVLAIFQEIGVNKDLYFLVFGESLLNDAVTVVLYGMMDTFTKMPTIASAQYGLGIAAFLTVNIGGLSVGVLVGVLTSIVTKFTVRVQVNNFIQYSIICCGLVQAHYAKKNISGKSYITIKYFTKMLSSICDSIIFLFLGMVLVETQHVWHTGFVLLTLLLCLTCRFIGVYFLTAIVNFFRQRKINFEEQFIMAYGGLRGAVSFSLVLLLDPEFVSMKQIFVTTTLVVVIFTVFIQGITIKPLVNLLRIKKSNDEKTTLFDEINYKLIDHVMAGIEEISGSLGDFYIKALFHHYNNKYIKPYLIRSVSVSGNLNKLYEKVTLADHFANLYGPAICLEDKKPLIKAMNNDTDLGEMVEGMITNGPAVDLRAGDIEVHLRQPSTWNKVQDQLKRSFSVLPETKPPKGQGVTTKLRMNHRQTLKRALSNNPYEKLHYRCNKNLINDEDQEVSSHLERRCSNAKRLTSIMLTPPFISSSQVSIGSEKKQPRARGRHSSEQNIRPHNVPAFSRSFSLSDQGNGNTAAPVDENLEIVVESPTEVEHDERECESRL